MMQGTMGLFGWERLGRCIDRGDVVETGCNRPYWGRGPSRTHFPPTSSRRRQGWLQPDQVFKFMFDGDALSGSETAASLDLEGDEVIEAHPRPID